MKFEQTFFDEAGPARVTGGEPYSGNTGFLGNGVQRSCGKCGTHQSGSGGRKHPILGWIGPCCPKPAKKP